MAKAKQDNPNLKVVVIDPRKTATCDIADLHLAIQPGMDHILFNGLLVYLHQNAKHNEEYIARHTEGLEAALDISRQQAPDMAAVASQCALPVAQVSAFYQMFADTEQVVSVFSQGMNQWSYGTDKGNSLINCHLLTGRLGRPGMGPFSFTGQPNAMGGREVGGLANQLAAHMDLKNPAHRELVQGFWQSPVVADQEGLKAVDMFKAIGEGKIKALWVMATNPAVSLPDAEQVRAALAKCEFLAVSDCMRDTDTSRYAHVRLPALAWGEREGMVTNSERRISRQRAFLPAPGDAKPDWWILAQVAQRMGHGAAFAYEHPREILCEHAALSGHENNGQRDFDISALAHLNQAEYDAFTPMQWPINEVHPTGTTRLFTDQRFYTPSGKAQFVAVAAHTPAHAPDARFPLRLNTGRIRDQWHTMTRTGKSPRLSGHRVEPFVSLHPQDARQWNVQDGGLARVSSQWGSIVVRVRETEDQRLGDVFIPMHWNDQFASKSFADALVNPAMDPISGQPEFKHTPVKVEPYAAQWYGFLLTRRRLPMDDASYWACARGNGLWRYEIAGDKLPDDWTHWSRDVLCRNAQQVEWIEYYDKAQSHYRAARLEDGRLESCLFVGPGHELPERDWLVALFEQDALAEGDRTTILTGKPGNHQHDTGRIICACFGIGLNTIQEAIRSQQLTSVEAIGQALRAGTNCGSCVPELREILESASKEKAVQA
jgi:assimilatory nitrate reductase catalytic subunit